MIDETDGLAIARKRIAREAKERTGFLDLGMLGLTELPEELFDLHHLRRLNLGEYWYEDGEYRWSSKTMAPNGIAASLAKLCHLGNLSSLWLRGCPLANLNNLASLTTLQLLDCAETQVSDLTPLASLASLQSLICSLNPVSDLAPIACLTNLQFLDCFHTRVSDLAPLAALANLQSLRCSWTQVSDLAPLAALTNLQSLRCSWTQVSDLSPLAALTNLQSLDCSSTLVSDLSPLASLANLRSLNCSGTPVSDLTPLAGLETLWELDMSRCRLVDVPRWLLDRQSLAQLILLETIVPGVPAGVLSQVPFETCRESLQAHVRDLEAGEVAVRDVKLTVLGNGRVGKTQLCRRLRGEPYDDTQPSTHGVLTTTAPLPDTEGGPETTLQIWDFGGQDLYHGTHALFMRSSALFLLAWTPALEDTHEVTHDGITFRNHPLAYWVEYVRHLGGKRSAVVVVQTRCDRAVDEAPCPVPEADLFAAFGFVRMVRYSARTDPDRGRPELNAALAAAAAWLREQEGIATIGAGRNRVKERLEALRDADASVPPEARQYRTISQGLFEQLCDEAGGVHSPEHLLAYLHNAGIVFYRKGLFGDAIILDQGWALEAIYAVFHREKCYRRIRRNRGRFSRSDLEDWVWQEHSVAEQELFLSMMQSCGICFQHRPAVGGAETEYIAPDLLPERAEIEVELAQKWDGDRPIETATFTYALLHPGLIRSIISRIGREAGIAADYWQGGVYVYETGTGSRGIIEAEMIDAWRGVIRIQTQRGRAAELLARLRALVEEEQNRAGLTPIEVTGAVAGRAEKDLREPEGEAAAVKVTFAQEPSAKPEWCFSYAWGDTTAEGQERERTVDMFCRTAEANSKTILRDKTAMGLGERISKFMQRIGWADRVFVFLSDKYLKSAFCMFELSEVWRNCRQEEEEFLARICVYTLPCAAIWSPEDRIEYAIHWKQRYEKLEAMVKEHGYDILGDRDAQEFRRMRDFSRNVSDILATVADILQPRSFEDLVKYGFSD